MLIFGILNLTPDSFSDGAQYPTVSSALEAAQQLINDGADVIDVGAEATNPKAEPITSAEEWLRLSKVLPSLLTRHPERISLDTRNPETARKFLSLGGTILNDVSGFQDPRMIQLAARFQPLCIINHFPGPTPKAVHNLRIDSMEQVTKDLLKTRSKLVKAGVSRENIVLDPGIGFGKTSELNRRLLRFAKIVPSSHVMIGYSRKRFLGKNRMEIGPNLEAATIAARSGAYCIRVHDVAAHKQHLKNLEK